MGDGLEALEARLAEVNRELEALRRRVAALESAPAAGAAATPATRRRSVARDGLSAAAAAAPGPASASASAPLAEAVATAPLAGRMFLVLAGAFVLRALTDAHVLPAAVGVALGVAYAGGVLALAARAPRPVAAGFHALTAALIAFPLLAEATNRFELLGPWLSALLLAAFGAAVLGVAARRRLQWVAWVGALAVIGTAPALAYGTARLLPAALALVAVGVLATWISYVLDWHALRWPPALAADLAVLALALRAAAPQAQEGPGVAHLAAAALVLAYLGSFAARTLYLGRTVVAFEVVQTGCALAAGLGSAAWLAGQAGSGTGALGAAALLAAAAAYAIAFGWVERRQPASGNFPFYASVGLAFIVVGAGLALEGPARGAAVGVLALAAGFLARWRSRRTLVLHAAILAVVAVGWSGLATHAANTLLATAAIPWPPLAPVALGVVACLAAAAGLAALLPGRATLAERAPQALLDAVLALAAAGVLAGWVVAALGPPGPAVDLALVATGRTAVLAAGACLAAWLGRREAGREAGWLAWPLVAMLGAKLLIEDLPRGRPATLILSLALTGAALILVPRLRARPAAATVQAA